MQKDTLYESLYNDYRAVTGDFAGALDNANTAFANLTTAKRSLARAKENLGFTIASALLAEMAEEGRINGKNADIRALQVRAFLAELLTKNGEVSTAQIIVDRLEAEADQYSIEYEAAKNVLSALRNRARMIAGLVIAGLAGALGGFNR